MKKFETPNELKSALLKVYDESTVHYNPAVYSNDSEIRKQWSPKNPTWGQCVPTSILVQKLFGGDIFKLPYHYYNMIDGEIVDLTSDQFVFEGKIVDYSKGVKKTTPFTQEALYRYGLLLKKLENLVHKNID